jgi:hypothetical protein
MCSAIRGGKPTAVKEVLTNITVAEYEGSTPLTLKPAVEHDPN